ncbi:hypothetical protein [Butyrivibrio sp. JL13D10]|uniref:hypothetical protein n=1 Tax=Butyrivibrio sp. JL13D10 TaxID=3236815 RepID=UPI0038B6A51D
MKAWINADGGSDELKLQIADLLKKRGWEVYVGKTYSNAHYEDYFNVTSDYQVYITIYNGFCAGTVREAYSSEIQKVLRDKGVTLVIIWDSSLWLEKMKPYRYGDFNGYHAKRSWDDNFSSEDPSIEDVGVFMKENEAVYCVGPTADLIMEQFDAGGYFNWERKSNNVDIECIPH